tara:strand:- start:189 stop:1229 length:1041 start_codon:yes stop_codon:yes gene_type:complete
MSQLPKNISRREALQAFLLGIGSIATESLRASLSSPSAIKRIDIHHHWHPPPLDTASYVTGIGDSWPGGSWSEDRAIEMMDQFNIESSILSMPNTKNNTPADICKKINEYASRIITKNPNRFGAFASIPQYDIGLASKEVIYSLVNLNLDGVLLHPSINNIYLGSPKLNPLMEALDRQRAIVLIHPTSPFYFNQLGLSLPAPMMEFVFETTRAIMNLISTGTLERFPNIKFITAHAGGTAPYIAARLVEKGEKIAEVAEKAPRGIMHYLKSLYFGTAQAASSPALKALLEVVDTSKIVFGTDLPISPPSLVDNSNTFLNESIDISPKQKYSILRGNAENLMPRFKI